jgi:alkyldihydroxyacetonephosphate synthase
VVLIPYGGGTNVTNSLLLSKKETRMIVSLDMTRMNKIKWVDKENQLACIEAGIFGQDMERELANYGMCTGHEPVKVVNNMLGLYGVFHFGRLDLYQSKWHEEELLRKY